MKNKLGVFVLCFVMALSMLPCGVMASEIEGTAEQLYESEQAAFDDGDTSFAVGKGEQVNETDYPAQPGNDLDEAVDDTDFQSENIGEASDRTDEEFSFDDEIILEQGEDDRDELVNEAETYAAQEEVDIDDGLQLQELSDSTGIVLDKSSANVGIAKTLQLKATVKTANATDKTLNWSSSNTDVATVDKNGKVTGKNYGTATITVKTGDGKQTVSCQVKVLFSDVMDSSEYYYLPVYWAADNNITNGYLASSDKGTARYGKFGHDYSCTRAHVVTFLWRMAGEPSPKTAKNPFKDIKSGKYYYKAVLWAAEQGITNGYSDGTFKPDAVCLREHVMTFLWRYAGKPSVSASKSPFKDVNKKDYYYQACVWANQKEIANGYIRGPHKGGFGPKLKCFRAHVVTFLYRYMKTFSWKEQYLNYMKNNKSASNGSAGTGWGKGFMLRYTLINLDGDDIPELLMQTDRGQAILMWSKNGLQKEANVAGYLGGLVYNSATGQIFSSSSAPYYNYHEVFQFADKEIDSVYRDYMETSGSTKKYYIGDKQVSYSQWNKSVKDNYTNKMGISVSPAYYQYDKVVDMIKKW